MSKNWYPMINYDKCTECGICVKHCTHGVYNKEKAPGPVVIRPEYCVEGCTGCGDKCPEEAIEYFGGNGSASANGCCCGSLKKHEAGNNESESGCGCKGGGCCVDNEVKQEKKPMPLYIKILIPSLILVLIAGVYLLKNSDSITKAADSGKGSVTAAQTFDLHVTDVIDLEQLKAHGLPIVIDFGADSCVPCKEMAPVLEKLNEELQGRAIVLFVDVWKYQGLSADFPIKVIPTQIFIDSEGKPYHPDKNPGTELIMYTNKETGEHVFTVHEGGLTEEGLLNLLKGMGLDK